MKAGYQSLEWSKLGFDPFVVADKISPPFTQILNRSTMIDPSKDLGLRFGTNRIPTHAAFTIQEESGPAFERVMGIQGDRLNQIRLVGQWDSIASAEGTFVQTNTSSDFIEITFYGTGVGILTDNNNTARDMRATVDGGAEGANFIGAANNVINSRSYNVNQVIVAVSGLSAGIHTVKLRSNSGSTNIRIYGLEVYNQGTSAIVTQGSMMDGVRKLSLSSNTSFAYDSGFESGVSNGRGGRVVVYLKDDGTIGKALQPVNASQANLSSADHTNEEIIRSYHFREFGSGRTSDDFSSQMTASTDRAFTLEDGTTTLVGDDVFTQGTPEGLRQDNTNDYFTFTFVGTGLDIIRNDGGFAGAIDATNVHVDGTLIGTISDANGKDKRTKIVSGLPYGTHTIRFTRTAFSLEVLRVTHFVVFGPKKPSIPTNAIEIADYNLMANFVANSTPGELFLAQGVLRKMNTREIQYNGTWSIGSITPATISGFQVDSPTAAGYTEYNFFGTGFDYRYRSDTDGSSSLTFTINGVTATTANFPTATFSQYGTGSFNSATGVMSQVSGGTPQIGGVRVSGLPLALYRVRLTNNNGGTFNRFMAFDCITPVHSPKSNSLYEQQNTLPVGSCAISDNRKLSPVSSDDSKKFRGVAVGIVANPSTTSTDYVPMPNMSLTVPSKGGWFKISGLAHISQSSGAARVRMLLYVNGVPVSVLASTSSTIAGGSPCNLEVLQYLPKGVHKAEIYWQVDSNTGTVDGANRYLLVEEL